MLDLCGAPILSRIVERVRKATLLNDLVVATSLEPEDQAVFKACTTVGVKVMGGPCHDVWDRLCQVARAYSADVIVKVRMFHELHGQFFSFRRVQDHLDAMIQGLERETLRCNSLGQIAGRYIVVGSADEFPDNEIGPLRIDKRAVAPNPHNDIG